MANTEKFIALRYLFNRKGEYGFVNINTTVAILGIAFGIAAIVIVLSVFNGFQTMTTDALVENNPKLRLYNPSTSSFDKYKEESLLYYNDKIIVEDKSGFVAINVLYLHFRDTTDYIFNFIENADTTVFYQHSGFNSAELSNSSLRYTNLESLELLAQTGFIPAFSKSNVRSVHLPFIDNASIIKLTKSLNESNLILDYYGDDTESLLNIASSQGIKIDTWQTLNSDILSILEIEKFFSTFVMFMIVCIGFFNMVAAISMLLTVKRIDFQTLSTLGLSIVQLKKIAKYYGSIVIALGLLAGMVISMSVIALQNSFGLISIDVDGRFIDNLPMTFELYQIAIVTLLVVVTGFFMIKIPVSQISVESLKQ